VCAGEDLATRPWSVIEPLLGLRLATGIARPPNSEEPVPLPAWTDLKNSESTTRCEFDTGCTAADSV